MWCTELILVWVLCEAATGSWAPVGWQTLNLPTVELAWHLSGNDICLGINAPTMGWVGLGISASGGMIGTDMGVAQRVNGAVEVTDRFASEEALPSIDESQDIELIEWQQQAGQTHFSFCRPLTNCDPHDIDIIGSEVKTFTVVYAFGDGDEISYHGVNRGLANIPLLAISPREGHPEAKESIFSFNFTMPPVTVPAGSSYHCTPISFPGPKVHVIGQHAFEDSGLAHHMVLYSCPSPVNRTGPYVCGVDMECAIMFAGWSVGGQDLLFPPEAGLAMGLGSASHFLLETHYENPTGSLAVDQSTLSLIYTDQLRPKEVGLLILGTHMSELDLEPGQSALEYVSECPVECSAAFPPQGLKTIMITSHMHSTGSRAWVSHVRDGKELPELYRNDWFSPNYVNIHQVDHTLLPGDRLINHCVFDTRGRTDVTRGGLAANEEMCWSVLFYYPKIDLDICMDASGLMEQNGLPLRSAYCASGEIGRSSDSNGRTGVELSFDAITLTQEPETITEPLPRSCKEPVVEAPETPESVPDEADEPVQKSDYIVVGGGTAGLVVARRLTDDPSISVVLIEEGRPLDEELFDVVSVPRNTFDTWEIPSLAHRFHSEASEWMLRRRMEVLRATTLGGTTQINGGLWSRMDRSEFDKWGIEGWSSSQEDTGRFVSKVEGTGENFGRNGSISIHKGAEQEFVSHFLQGCKAAGLPVVDADDFHRSSIGDGFSAVRRTTKSGRRESSYTAYLEEILDRPNLEIIDSAIVAKVVFDPSGTWALGVDFIKDGKTLRRLVRREVILSAGVWGTPKILLLSGVGPEEELNRHEIKIIKAASGVGQNLVARPLTLVGNTGRVIAPEMDVTKLYGTESVRQFRYNGTGPLALGPAGALGAFKTDPSLDQVDVQLEFTNTMPMHELPPSSWLLACILIHPKSVGQVRLGSADPLRDITIEPNMYSRGEDVTTMIKCIQKARAIVNSSALDEIRGDEFTPGDNIQSDFELAGFILASTRFAHHAFGTCKLGDVVDEKLRVRGFRNLRVVDASVVPSLTSGPMSLMYVLAEKASDLILKDKDLEVPPQFVFDPTFTRNLRLGILAVCITIIAVPAFAFLVLQLRVHLLSASIAKVALVRHNVGSRKLPGRRLAHARSRHSIDLTQTEEVCVSFAKLNYYIGTTPDSRRILRNLSGFLHFGEMMAVMGGSGCGKSTLLEVLAARRNTGLSTGYITYRARDDNTLLTQENTSENRQKIRERVGFVPQLDELQPGLSAFDTLVYAAILKLPAGTPLLTKLTRVREVLKLVELEQHKDTKVQTNSGGLSGGQERRLSVAIQLLKLPQLIILDEPTTGLDASTALSLVDMLHKIALRERTAVVLTIHQPRYELFRLFNRVMLLGEGRQIFMGSPSELLHEMTEVVRDNPDHCDPAISKLVYDDGNELSADLVMDVFKDTDLMEIAIQYGRQRAQAAVEMALKDYHERTAGLPEGDISLRKRISLMVPMLASHSKHGRQSPQPRGMGSVSRHSGSRRYGRHGSTGQRHARHGSTGQRHARHGSTDQRHARHGSTAQATLNRRIPQRTQLMSQTASKRQLKQATFIEKLTVTHSRFTRRSLFYRFSFVASSVLSAIIFMPVWWQLDKDSFADFRDRVYAVQCATVMILMAVALQVDLVFTSTALPQFSRDYSDATVSVFQFVLFAVIRDTFILALGALLFWPIVHLGWGFRVDDLSVMGNSYLLVTGLLFANNSFFSIWSAILDKASLMGLFGGIVAVQMLFAGALVRRRDLPVIFEWLPSYLPLYHAVGSLVKLEMQDLPMDCGKFDIPQVCSTGNDALKDADYLDMDHVRSLAILYTVHICCRILAYLVLRRQFRNSAAHLEPQRSDLFAEADLDPGRDEYSGVKPEVLMNVLETMEEEEDMEEQLQAERQLRLARVNGLQRLASQFKLSLRRQSTSMSRGTPSHVLSTLGVGVSATAQGHQRQASASGLGEYDPDSSLDKQSMASVSKIKHARQPMHGTTVAGLGGPRRSMCDLMEQEHSGQFMVANEADWKHAADLPPIMGSTFTGSRRRSFIRSVVSGSSNLPAAIARVRDASIGNSPEVSSIRVTASPKHSSVRTRGGSEAREESLERGELDVGAMS